jgi:glycosyltransferase involved in cell wall biosynthesis
VDSSPCLREHRERCHVIPFGIPEKHFHQPSEKAISAIRARHGDRIVLSVGRLVYYKGLNQLILAMAEVPGRLLIAGTGPLLPDLLKLVRSLHLDDRVEFLGAPDDDELRALYHAADVFVLASTARSEAFGLVQVEAMAAGTPVVNTSVDSGVPFVSVHGTTGLTVPPSDSKALAMAISSLLDDPQLRLQYGNAARFRAESMFRCSTMADRTLQMYQEVAGCSAVKYAAAAYA